MESRVYAYDLMRTFAIIVVFLGHSIERQTSNQWLLLGIRSLSPGLTMSLLGFLSAALLARKQSDPGSFLLSRFTRIYIPMFSCLGCILLMQYIIRQVVICQHTLMHLMGLSAFFELFQVANKASIGGGLWFITVILTLYLLLPLFQSLFLHRNKLIHFVGLVLLCTAFNVLMYGTASTWNVTISFLLDTYLVVNGHMDRLKNLPLGRSSLFAVGLLTLVILATAEAIPFTVRQYLYVFYPLAFVPLFFHPAKKLPRSLLIAASFFSVLSYEFYILHFYFINERFSMLFPNFHQHLSIQISVSFAMTTLMALTISRFSSKLRFVVNNYLLSPPLMQKVFDPTAELKSAQD